MANDKDIELDSKNVKNIFEIDESVKIQYSTIRATNTLKIVKTSTRQKSMGTIVLNRANYDNVNGSFYNKMKRFEERYI